MELMAASRVVKAQQAVRESSPYARALTRAVSAVATFSNEDHPLTSEKEDVKRAAVVIMTSDRGLAGAYSSSAIKESERLIASLRDEGKEVVPYLLGRKAIAFYKFRHREFAAEWSGASERPSFETAREVGERLVADFTTPTEEGGIDEVHIVFTRFVSMVTQEPEVIRLLPLEVVEGEEAPAPDDLLPLYDLRARAPRGARRAAAEVRQRPSVQLHAPGRRVRARRPPAGDEVGDGQRRGAHQEVHPVGQPGPPGRDHPRDQRNRRRRQCPGREQVSERET
jgi:hypothetical protein